MCQSPRHRNRRLMFRAVLPCLLFVVFSATACIEPPTPRAFYQPPSPLPAAPPGTVLRREPLPAAPAGSRGWRLLYVSTGLSGEPIAVSGVIFVPNGQPPPSGRHIIAWAHPTTGVASRCAPSVRPAALLSDIPGLESFLAAGAIVVATDYPGLGTPGPHPYLIGFSEARAVLDSVRAARAFPEAGAGMRYAVWGHSQGGHASLFAGQLAAGYAPELQLVGIATAAPASELTEILTLDLPTLEGRVLASMAFVSWSEVVPGAGLEQIARSNAAPAMRAIARGCIETTPQVLAEAVGGLVLGRSYLHASPAETQPWRDILASNTPNGSLSGAPLFLAQGEADTVVRPEVNRHFTETACRRGTSVLLQFYPGVTHTTIARDAAADAASWIGDRFAGRTPPSNCADLPQG
jgi:alpha-beta hydrolase superfamily lysophospholipase